MHVLWTPPTAPGDPVAHPWLVGIGAVWIGGPALGAVLGVITGGHSTSDLMTDIQLFGMILLLSPMFSWIVLIVMLPTSLICARAECAGWGVALCFGTGFGACAGAAILGETEPLRMAVLTGIAGGVLALLFWGALRLFYPIYFGIGRITETIPS